MFHKQAIVLLDLTKFYKNKLTDPESLRKLCKKKKKKKQNKKTKIKKKNLKKKKKKKIKTVFASFKPLLAQD